MENMLLRISRTCSAMVLLLLASCAIAETNTDLLAQYAIEQTGLPKGICSMPRAGDGQLAVALTRSGWLVQAMDADAVQLATARKSAEAVGVLGKSLYIEEGSPAAIPFASDYVNLLIISDATDDNLGSVSLPEIVRVLVPETGKALIGLANPSAGTVSRSRLEKWAKNCAGASVTVVSNQHGLWAIVTKDAQPGAVDWTHRLYNPANNPVSSDTACAWPLMTQWLGRPFLSPLPLILVAQGRMAGVRLVNGAALEMYDAHNGMLLWRRPLPDASVATRTSGMVLFSNALYLAEKPGVLIFDPVTGREIGRVDCSDLGAQVKWLAVQKGVLFAMAGSMERPAAAHQTWKFFGSIQTNYAKCQGIGAYQLSDAKWLWMQKESDESLDEGVMGLCSNRLYYYVNNERMVCRDACTGKVLWDNAKAVEKVKQFGKGDTRGHPGALICSDSDNFLAIHKPGCGSLILSATNGEPFWATSASSMLFYRDLLLIKGGHGGVYDAATGKASDAFGKKGFGFGGGCGMFTLTPLLVCGQNGLTYDCKADKPLELHDYGSPLEHKTPCLSGSFVADGLYLGGSVSCVCRYTLRGTVVQAPAPSVPQVQGGESGLLRRAAKITKCATFAVDDSDWSTFRANNERGNASRVTISPTAKLNWSWRPETGTAAVATNAPAKPFNPASHDSTFEPVQVTAAGKLVFVPGRDGSVSALELASGITQWRFFTGARLYAPPTLADGRCYIGSGDGCVYCLEATSGRELWRYRVAPLDRRIMVYGDLVSTWPITGGVLIQTGVVYAAAGILDEDGAYVAALDAQSGEVKWRNDTSGHLDAYRCTGVAACGYPALAKGRLWIRTASYDLDTGACRPFADTNRLHLLDHGMLARYTGMFANKFLVSGGQRFFQDQYALGSDDYANPYVTEQDRGNDGVLFMELADDTIGKLPGVNIWGRCRMMPSWDSRQLVALPVSIYQTAHNPAYEEDLVCWDAARTTESLAGVVAAAATNVAQAYRSGRIIDPIPLSKRKPPDKLKGETFEAPQQDWSVQSDRFIAVALAANAVVAARGTPGYPGQKSHTTHKIEPASYALTAYNRADGKVLWDLPLAGEPLMDGISIARDGTLLVRLLDGTLQAFGGQ